MRHTLESLVIATGLSASMMAVLGAEPDPEAYGHNVALSLGIAQEGQRDRGLALGAEYEYRLGGRFGLGILVERTFGDMDTWVYAVPFAYHSGPWKLYAALGSEDGEHGNESLLRIGGEYGFEVGGWEIGPQLDVDFVDDEEVWVIGVAVGRGLEF